MDKFKLKKNDPVHLFWDRNNIRRHTPPRPFQLLHLLGFENPWSIIYLVDLVEKCQVSCNVCYQLWHNLPYPHHIRRVEYLHDDTNGQAYVV